MTLTPFDWIGYAWMATGAVWLAAYAFTKRTVRAQPLAGRLFHVGLAALGYVLLSGRWFRAGWLARRFIPQDGNLLLAAAAVTTIGCAFAIWARLALGTNWSGRVTVKEGHELITSGPYAIARHPIYTGLLLAVAGTVLAVGEWRGVAALALVLIAFLVKIGQEEQLMMQTFPEAYPAYKQRVKALIPGVM
jgi:protein-S-isoprenylcysteine O-methyltransferase Ste14